MRPITYDANGHKRQSQRGNLSEITRHQFGNGLRYQIGRVHFSDDATALILRVSEGTLRAVKNLCVGALIEAVRDRTKTVDLKQVNAVLMQPHWRHNSRDEPAQPLVSSNQKPRQ